MVMLGGGPGLVRSTEARRTRSGHGGGQLLACIGVVVRPFCCAAWAWLVRSGWHPIRDWRGLESCSIPAPNHRSASTLPSLFFLVRSAHADIIHL